MKARASGFARGRVVRPQHLDFETDWPRLIAKAVVVESGCWEWQAATRSNGYGAFGVMKDGRHVVRGAHVVAYALANGVELPESCVLHRCDNRCCINPDHLFLGTQRDNIDDMRSKGRHCYGVRRNNAALKDSSVAFIRSAYRDETHTNAQLSDIFGVSPQVVSSVAYGRTWRHVPGSLHSVSRSKLDERSVKEIRALHAAGRRTKDLAASYGVSTSTISNIIAGRKWRHAV